MLSHNRKAGCLICASEDADDEAVIFRDELWACEVTPGYEVPGWLILRARRHTEGWTGLHEEEINSLGRRARDVVKAVTLATGAPATYVVSFGESYPHFHVLVIARSEHVPPENRSGNILLTRQASLDRTAAIALVPTLRELYEGQRS